MRPAFPSHRSSSGGFRRRRPPGALTLPLAGAAVLALGSGLLTGLPAYADEARGHGPANTSWPTPAPRPPSAEASAIDTAKGRAKSSGKPVLIDHLTTASSQTFATPNGTLATETSLEPERVKNGSGHWQKVDATLRTNTDGTVTPAAVPSPLSFSGGGTGPMATMTTADGKKLALKAPFPLPKPALNGASALYSSVLPGVDLKLTATPAGGWRQVLIVRTAEAAASPSVKKLRLPVEADGLTVSADGAGNLKAVDAQGNTRFTAPTPLMWDSARPEQAAPAARSKSAGALAKQSAPAEGISTPSSSDGPGTGAGVQPIATTVDAQGIQLVPDDALLQRGTGPWYIDPGWAPTANNANQAWAQVQEAYEDTNEFNGTQYGQDKPATGYCGYNVGNPPCDGIGRTRAYFQIGVDSRLYNTEILSARFEANVISSSSPSTVTPMGLYSTGYISNPTSWNRQPCDKNSHMGGCTKVAGISMSGSGGIAFDVKGLVKTAVRYQWPTITMGLAPDDEYNKYYRQRFDNSPRIVVEYDITPTVSAPRTGPTPGFADTNSYAGCRTPGTTNPWDNPGWVGSNNNITLTTDTYSATGLQLWTAFKVWDDDDGGKGFSAESGWNGSSGPVSVDVGPLIDGHQYGWHSRTADGFLTSADSEYCFLRVDRTPPTASVTSTDFPASGTIGAHPKLAGQEGTFTLTGADPAPASGNRTSGLACARWTTDPVKASATGWKCTDDGVIKLTGGKATIKVTPPHWGTNYVYLQTQDNAGNMSQPFVYSYYAPNNPDAGKPVFGDINGDRKPDVLLPDATGNLRKIAGGEDPYGAPKADIKAAPGNSSNWNGIQISHRGSLGRKVIDDLFAHEPGNANLYLYTNDSTGRFDGQAPGTVTKPTACVTPANATIDCAAHGYGADWGKVTQIAAFGSTTGDSDATPDSLPRTSLLFVENGRLWLTTAGTTDALSPQAILLSANDTKWDGYELIAPGRAQGTDFPTLWARSKADGSLHALSVKGTAQAPDLTGFTNPAAGLISGRIDTKAYPQVGSDGDLSGDGIPDLWAVDANKQLVAFNGTGTATPYPAVTGVSTTPVTLGNLNTPKAQWLLTDPGGTTVPSVIGNYPGTAAGITWAGDSIGGRATSYAQFKDTSSFITTTGPVIDTRKSFTISAWVKADALGGAVISQDLNRNSSLLLFPNHIKKVWQFSLANGDTSPWPYDETTQVNSTADITPGAWTRLTAVYDHTTGHMRLYVNGTLAATGQHGASSSPAPVGPFTLGRFKDSGAYSTSPFKGGVSNLAVYPYAASVTAPAASSPISLTAAAGSCIDNASGDTEDGNRIQIWGCSDNWIAQQFEMRNDGTVHVQGKCLNAAGAGTTNGTPIELRTCDSSAGSQKFLPRADNGLYNPASNRCLDLGNFNTTPGTLLWLYDCNSSPAQRWTIPTLGTAPLPIPTP
ncbi:LamG-like jellyroll fold domain-containing protein [Streptomyces sp. NPDC048337]|uniref:LamG-like jellyroll fold domain-containing protein n=1 Tax=Streptomyces sp. NPDC048337 TaxID=3365535 RepID=UPI00371954D7